MRRLDFRRLAWVPIPILLAVLIGLWAADLQGSHESLYLLLILNLVFSTLVSLLIAYLIARSFLARGTAGLLLLGCGVVIWGPAGIVATAAARGDANLSITIHNSCIWLSGLCHLAGVWLSLRPRLCLPGPVLWLPAAYLFAAGAIMVVTLAALAGWIPAFFVPGQGGTPMRQVVLLSAVGMFSLTAFLLAVASRQPLSAFAYWYALALLLIAVGLFGVSLQSYHASLLSWTGRATQALGGLYMLIAAVASVRESHAWRITLQEALRESEARYRTLFETAPDAIIVHRDGQFLRANDATLRLSGADSFQDLARHSVLDFFRPQEREQAAERISLAQRGCQQPIWEVALRRLDGREVVVELHTGPVDFQGVPAVQTILRDVTDRQRAQEQLGQALRNAEQRYAETSALMTCTRAVLESRDLVAAVRLVFNACRELLGAQAGYVAALTPDGQRQEVLFMEPGGLSCTVEPSLPMPIRGFRAEVYGTGRAIYENDFTASPWARLLPSGHVRLENVLFAPMVIDGSAIGLLALGNKPGGFTDPDAALAATFGELTAIALRNSRTLESLRELNATLESKVAERTAELEQRTQQLQRLTLELSQAQEREHRRVALVLHEDLQQQIAGAKLQLNLLSQGAKHDPVQRSAAAQAQEILKGVIGMSRSLSHELSPAVFYGNDLGEALDWLAEQMEALQGLRAGVEVAGEGTLQSEALTIFLFRAARELLSNTIRHAGVREAKIRLRRMGRYVGLRVGDRGCGFDPQALRETAGLGLLSLRERVELLGGRTKIRSAAGRGTTVRIVVPDVPGNRDKPL